MKKLTQFFKALSDETRLNIIALILWQKKLCVCDIEKILNLTQSKASRHLRYLLNNWLENNECKICKIYLPFIKKLKPYHIQLSIRQTLSCYLF